MDIITGKFSDNKYNGQGKEFDNDDIIIYEGEFVDGVKQGKGIEYDDDGNIVI